MVTPEQKRIEIDDPDKRRALTRHTTVGWMGDIPSPLFSRPCIVVGNYIEAAGSLNPMLYALTTFDAAISGDGDNRLIAVARQEFLETLDPQFHMITPIVIPAMKQEDRYEIGAEGTGRILQHLMDKKAVWMAPGATTKADGLVEDFHTGAFRFAMQKGLNCHLIALAMITRGEGSERNVVGLGMKEVLLPTVSLPPDLSGDLKKQYLMLINHEIGRYALAETAALLPPEQEHGAFRDHSTIKADVRNNLRAMRSLGVIVEGGFLDEAG